MDFEIRDLTAADVPAIIPTDGGNGWSSSRPVWERHLADQRSGVRTVLIAWDGVQPVGYGTIDWASDYEPFRSLGMPDINNLSVARQYRRRGVATAIIRALENVARTSGHQVIGIGVGLYADYGDAQRLYAGLGYRPDGRGITYRGRVVAPDERVPLDDELILWLTKPL